MSSAPPATTCFLWEKRRRTRPGRVLDVSHTRYFEETDASRTCPQLFPHHTSGDYSLMASIAFARLERALAAARFAVRKQEIAG
eukprot:gene18694-biopygen9972